MRTRDDIYRQVTGLISQMFELDPSQLTEDAHLYEDLDIDSIDAVDLIVELKDYTGKKISPDDFKNVRTIGDIVRAVEDLLTNG